MKYAYIINALSTLCAKEQIMKLIKFIPALAMIALLSACGTKSGSFKAPKFVKEGASIEKDTFVTELNTAIDASVYKGEEAITRSFVSDTSYSSENSAIVYKNGKKYSETIQQGTFTANMKADIKNHVAYLNGEQTSSNKMTQGNAASIELKNNQRHEIYLQSFLFDGVETFGEVIKSERIFIPIAPITETTPEDLIFDSLIKDYADSESALSATIYLAQRVNSMDEAMLETVSLFKNNNVYTYVYEQTFEPEETLDDEDKLVKKVEKKNYEKMQVTIQGSNFKFVAYELNETTTTYFQDSTYSGTTLKSGDSVVEKERAYEVSNIQSKNVTVKPQSIDGYLLGSMI